MVMNAEGARQWKRNPADNIGKSVAIVLDNYVYSFPTVQTEISGEDRRYSNFTINETNDLSNILKSVNYLLLQKLLRRQLLVRLLVKKLLIRG